METIYDIIFWILLVIYGVGGALCVLDTCIGVYEYRKSKQQKVIPQSYAMVIILSFHIWICLAFKRDFYFKNPQSALLGMLWLVVVVCAIINHKLQQKQDWGEYAMKTITKVMEHFELVRDGMVELGERCVQVDRRIKIALVIVEFVLAVGCIFFDALVPFVAVLITVSIFLVYIHGAMHSCRTLLICWTLFGFLFGLIVSELLLQAQTATHHRGLVYYIIFVSSYLLFWIYMTAIADHDVAKIACVIVNTCTTLMLLGFNVLFMCIAAQGYTVEGVLLVSAVFQLYINLLLLPITISGYMAGLVKEVQIYWENKYG